MENVSEKDVDVKLIDIILLDKNEAEIATIAGIISPVNAGEIVQLN